MRSIKPLCGLMFLWLSAIGCSLSPIATPPPTHTPPPTLSVPTITPLIQTPTLPFTPTPRQPTPVLPTETLPPAAFTAEVTGARVNLRFGPSTLTQITGTVYDGNYVQVQAKAPGDEWFFIRTTQGQDGWVSGDFIDLHGRLDAIPVSEPIDYYVIEGDVRDNANTPVNGVVLAVYQESNPQFRTDATTGQNGHFYAYLPNDTSGRWIAEVVGIDCTSWIMGPDCRLTGSFSGGGRENFEPPLSRPLYFVYQQ